MAGAPHADGDQRPATADHPSMTFEHINAEDLPTSLAYIHVVVAPPACGGAYALPRQI